MGNEYTGTIFFEGGKRCQFYVDAGDNVYINRAQEKAFVRRVLLNQQLDSDSDPAWIEFTGDWADAASNGELTPTSVRFD